MQIVYATIAFELLIAAATLTVACWPSPRGTKKVLTFNMPTPIRYEREGMLTAVCAKCDTVLSEKPQVPGLPAGTVRSICNWCIGEQ